jgi:hypothetical protein
MLPQFSVKADSVSQYLDAQGFCVTADRASTISMAMESPPENGLKRILRHGCIAETLGKALPLGLHGRCKLIPFLRLRAVDRASCLYVGGKHMIIPRINLLARHTFSNGSPHHTVREWATKIIHSGWLHQIYPGGASIQTRASKFVRFLLRYEHTLPSGMRQAYFDQAQIEKKILGWTRTTDGQYTLCL